MRNGEWMHACAVKDKASAMSGADVMELPTVETEQKEGEHEESGKVVRVDLGVHAAEDLLHEVATCKNTEPVSLTNGALQ